MKAQTLTKVAEEKEREIKSLSDKITLVKNEEHARVSRMAENYVKKFRKWHSRTKTWSTVLTIIFAFASAALFISDRQEQSDYLFYFAVVITSLMAIITFISKYAIQQLKERCEKGIEKRFEDAGYDYSSWYIDIDTDKWEVSMTTKFEEETGN